jgi:hypothetical protein
MSEVLTDVKMRMLVFWIAMPGGHVGGWIPTSQKIILSASSRLGVGRISYWFVSAVKQSHHIIMEVQGERRYSSYSFMTSALDGSEWSASRPSRALPSGKDPPPRYPLYSILDGPHSRSGQEATEKILSPLPGIEPQSPGRPVCSQTL